jgi:hypothetical protein
MFSFHLTGSLWFLLCLPPGLVILWHQYRVGIVHSGPRFGRHILFGLQALALFILTLSLTGPELRTHQGVFHKSSILILRDQSGSFRNGVYLGLGEAYAKFTEVLQQNYQSQNIEVRIADFSENTWPVSGFSSTNKL